MVSWIWANCKWDLMDEEKGSQRGFDWVVCAMPSAQCAQILPENVDFIPEIRQRKMDGCFALMLGFKKPLDLPWQALKVTNSPISWICVNSSKPGGPAGYSLLVHSSNSWAEAHLEGNRERVQRQLIKELESITGLQVNHFDHIALHGWRYANIRQQDKRVLLDRKMNIGVCGDWCVEGKVEGAFASALALSSRLKELL